MVRFGKKAAVLAAAGALTALSVTGCSGSINTDAVVVTVGDEEITLGVANFYARMTQGQYETYYAGFMGITAKEMWTQEADGDKTYEETTKEALLVSLEDLYLISQHAGEYEVSLSEDEHKAIEEAVKKFDEANTDEAKEIVSGYRKDVQKYLELVTVSQKMADKMKEGVNEEVSDEEAAQKAMQYVYFSYTSTDDEGNSTDLSDEEKESLKGTAQTFCDAVKAGTDIETAAVDAGVEVQTATFDAESATPDAALVAAADALANEGDVTDVTETEKGLYVAKLTSLLDREATDAEKQNIIEERKQEQYDSLLEQWREDTEIKVDEKVWKKVDFIDYGVTVITSEEESADGTADEGAADDGTDESASDGETSDGASDETAE
ncbi:MAG TPA: peptidyl-prolyl cis-trans isomerase [Candidatus Mediterraneibacter merdavium]|nr:peptidyl-prolyl cis-trans isomerase [Candidatus Mediterraneibacter merdavium]